MTFLQSDTLIQLDREIIAEGGLAEFVKLAWHLVEPGELKWNWHLDVVCQHLEAVSRGEIKNLLVLLPPGTMKSLLVSSFYPAWEWTFKPETKWIYCSYAQNLSNKNAKHHRDIVQSKWFQDRWGSKCNITRDTTKQVQMFENAQHGFRFSTAVGAGVTGRHANRLVFDDLLKAQVAYSSDTLDRANDYWFNTMATRQADANTTSKIGIMQRLHTHDTAQLCIDKGYTVVSLPMEFNPRTPCKFSIPITSEDFYEPFTEDPRIEEGELLWEDRFSREAVEDLKQSLGPLGTAAQLDQTPIAAGGTIFKVDDFKQFWGSNPHTEIPHDAKWIMSADCTFEDEKTAINPDYVVIQVWASKGPNFYLIDQVRKKMDIIATCQAIESLQIQYPKITSTHIEKKANGAAVIRILSETISGLKPYPPKGQPMPGKVERANAIQPLMGNVWLPSGKIWMDDFIKELLAFPLSRHDDQVDACSMSLDILHKPGRSRYLAALGKIAGERNLSTNQWQ